MKKLFMTMLTVLACGAVHALPVGNPSEASLLCDGIFWEGNCCDPCDPCSSWCDAWSIRLGFYGDYVWQSHLESKKASNPDIDHFEIFTNAGYLAFNMWDRVDFFATLGATNFNLETEASPFLLNFNQQVPLVGSRFDLRTETKFSWSVGGRVTLWECGCTTLGFEGQYFRTKPDVNLVAINAFGINPDNTVDATYREWQVGLGVSHRINVLVPYIAVKYASACIDFDNALLASPGQTAPVNDIQLFGLETKNHWGFAAGVSLIDCEKGAITVEGRWADQTALYVNGQIRF